MNKIIFILVLFLYTEVAFANDIHILATVDGQPITNVDIIDRVRVLEKITQNRVNERDKHLMLEVLIDEMVVLSTAQQFNIQPNHEEIEQSLEPYYALNLSESDMHIVRSYATVSNLIYKILEVHVIPYISLDQDLIKKRLVERVDSVNSKSLVTFTKYTFPNSVYSENDIKLYMDKILENKSAKLPEGIKVSKSINVKIDTLSARVQEVILRESIGSTPIINTGSNYIVLHITEFGSEAMINGSLEGVLISNDQDVSETFRVKRYCFQQQDKFFKYEPITPDMIKEYATFSVIPVNEQESFVVCNNSLQTEVTNDIYQDNIGAETEEFIQKMRDKHIITYISEQ
ncbi:MAG: hypothetical protein P857_836 [Candidatus Xenolissoclinum pacificiensis L6]|uniref:Uncharacterized protein n=1 Tax=Candidatus Xenolissoclinum pacificiensis L6 TaxID=1401685 RepID=W2UZS1_9RICK|nr:MAG: hypothetical protein P857_836 [Candidatus Xenolissoclinum pacificiensis L6]